eukprot:CAMPEP_0170171248 /NCGR_PEP_ID=MMETSP0040_2-20121228/4370_1 /TAXON_ID=641309 /ORGANISM="Lotharella oceanica, Strain CCMP622" /LENGTH=139 /DNA_ID=CAMNT_0010411187 /DNA_START=443 /DNA_END=862 /DNA_ORIENTATION=+
MSHCGMFFTRNFLATVRSRSTSTLTNCTSFPNVLPTAHSVMRGATSLQGLHHVAEKYTTVRRALEILRSSSRGLEISGRSPPDWGTAVVVVVGVPVGKSTLTMRDLLVGGEELRFESPKTFLRMLMSGNWQALVFPKIL